MEGLRLVSCVLVLLIRTNIQDLKDWRTGGRKNKTNPGNEESIFAMEGATLV